MTNEDLYAILSVMPNAEAVVIKAAYRALAQQYHPDRWVGSPDEAHHRMSSLNYAYSILSDPLKRAEYDKSVNAGEKATFPNDDPSEDAFTSAISETEGRWQIACSVYPDLVTLRKNLSQVSAGLAFAFVTSLLNSKAFSRRDRFAQELERTFLKRYFGSNTRILAYARQLILAGNRSAAKKLNQLLDVLGGDADPDPIIDAIEREFGFSASRERPQATQERNYRVTRLIQAIKESSNYRSAFELAEMCGYSPREVGAGFFRPMQVAVTDKNGSKLQFEDFSSFVHWVRVTLCC